MHTHTAHRTKFWGVFIAWVRWSALKQTLGLSPEGHGMHGYRYRLTCQRPPTEGGGELVLAQSTKVCFRSPQQSLTDLALLPPLPCSPRPSTFVLTFICPPPSPPHVPAGARESSGCTCDPPRPCMGLGGIQSMAAPLACAMHRGCEPTVYHNSYPGLGHASVTKGAAGEGPCQGLKYKELS